MTSEEWWAALLNGALAIPISVAIAVWASIYAAQKASRHTDKQIEAAAEQSERAIAAAAVQSKEAIDAARADALTAIEAFRQADAEARLRTAERLLRAATVEFAGRAPVGPSATEAEKETRRQDLQAFSRALVEVSLFLEGDSDFSEWRYQWLPDQLSIRWFETMYEGRSPDEFADWINRVVSIMLRRMRDPHAVLDRPT